MLTPAQIQSARQQLGINSVSAPMQNRAQELDAAWGQSTSAPQNEPPVDPFPQSALENIRSGNSQDNLETGKGAVKQLMRDISSAGAQNAGPVGQDMLKHAPEFAKDIGSFNTATTPSNQKQEEGAFNTKFAEIVAPSIEPVGSLVRSVYNGVRTAAPSIAADEAPAISSTPPEESIAKIQDNIAPKVNAKETKIALREGRIAPGKDPTLLRDGTPDQVLPSTRTARAANTIDKNIPGAAEMKQPELYAALDKKVGEMSEALKPAMEATPVQQETLAKIDSDWKALKTAQMNDPYAPSEANVAKLQVQFENNYLKSGEISNMNDLWEAAKSYDASVPRNVKEATSLSSDVLQKQKALWLQNRAIFRDAINDTANGMGDVSKQTFEEMSDMYHAQKNIESSYKVPKEGAPSKLKEFGQSPTGKVIKHAVAGMGILEGGKRLLTGSF